MERPLRNLVLLYFEGNRPQEALPLADELVRLHQILSPQDPALQAEQVDVLNLRASLLVALNRPQEARLDLDAAVAKGRQLLKLDPQNPGLQYGLAGSLVNVSQVADLLGNWAQALKPALEAEALLRQLARSQPQLIGDWAKALSRLGQAYARGGEPAQARPPLEESIDLLRLLARSGPAETLTVEMGGYRDDLAHALESLAVVQQQLNRPQESRAAAVEAMELYRALATVDPRYGKDVERTRAWLSSLPQGTLMRP
jgi:tetratricopeptide (TPR) repeat protein